MKQEISKIIFNCDLCKRENVDNFATLEIDNFYNYHICNICQQKLADFLEEIGFYE